MKLTRENLHPKGFVHQGYNRDQLAVLGVSWPARKGWLSKLVGTEIPDERYELFLTLGDLPRKDRIKLKRKI